MISMTTLIGGRLAGREPTEDDVEPLTWAMWERAREHGHARLPDRAERGSRPLRPVDRRRFLAPTTSCSRRRWPSAPVPIGEIHGRGPEPWEHYRRSGQFTPYTAIVNVTGLPAISLPLYHGEDGLPTGVQLIGRPLREDVLLALARQLEQALPWAERRRPEPPTRR